jgi:hypothetical protein
MGVDFERRFTVVELGCGNGALLFPFEEELLTNGTYFHLLGLLASGDIPRQQSGVVM